MATVFPAACCFRACVWGRASFPGLVVLTLGFHFYFSPRPDLMHTYQVSETTARAAGTEEGLSLLLKLPAPINENTIPFPGRAGA